MRMVKRDLNSNLSGEIFTDAGDFMTALPRSIS
jgi:hypothetical protein